MVYHVMPVLDLVSAVVVLFSPLLPGSFLYYIAGYLLVKGGIFVLTSRDFASMLDIAIGVYLVLIAALGLSHVLLNSAAAIFLAQKGALGLVAL